MAEERQLVNEERASSGKSRRRRSSSKGKRYPADKPWGLVAFIVLGLALLGLYIGWLNAPEDTRSSNVFSYLLGDQEVEPTVDPSTTRADSLAIWGDSPLTSTALDQGATEPDIWGTEPPTAPVTVPNDAFQTDQPPTVSSPPPPPTTVPDRQPTAPPAKSEVSSGVKSYQIIAGKFRSRRSARQRLDELRQGNYPASIIEPNSSDGYYEVIAGEYESYKRARSKADEMGFILEFKASVEEKIR